MPVCPPLTICSITASETAYLWAADCLAVRGVKWSNPCSRHCCSTPSSNPIYVAPLPAPRSFYYIQPHVTPTPFLCRHSSGFVMSIVLAPNVMLPSFPDPCYIPLFPIPSPCIPCRLCSSLTQLSLPFCPNLCLGSCLNFRLH